MTFPTIAVTPIHHRRSMAFVSRRDDGAPDGLRCGIEPIDQPVYPPSPEGEKLRKERQRAGLGLGEGARALGLSAMEMSQLERGSRRFELAYDWIRAREVLTREGRRRRGLRIRHWGGWFGWRHGSIWWGRQELLAW